MLSNKNDYILYKIDKNEEREPDLKDLQTRDEILEFVYQKNKFDYNAKLIENIQNNNFKDDDFKKLGQNNKKTLPLEGRGGAGGRDAKSSDQSSGKKP